MAESIRTLAATGDLKHVTDAKSSELDQLLLSSLEELLSGRDTQTAALEDEEVTELQHLLARILHLVRIRPIEGFCAPSARDTDLRGLDMVEGLAARGTLRYRNEEKVRKPLISNAVGVI